MGKILTSESVTPGHPDKLCDRISDSILDALLSEDPDSRVAVETMATAHTLTIAGEVTTKADVSPDFYEKIAGEVYDTIGYDRPAKVNVDITEQSPQIAQGVFGDTIQGAGDQGIMFGYATNEFADYMPAPITLAHGLAQKLWGAYRSGLIDALGPDGKTQVTCSYGEDGIRVDTVVVSAQHSEGVEFDDVKREIIAKVIRPYLVTNLKLTPSTIMVNPAGPWTVGGPEADTGLTGRKIIVDTYGGAARHGGGAFSGKDPSKVDRSAAYMARYLAKNIVARGIADRCEIQLSYAIGYPEPVSVLIETFGTGDPAEAEKFVGKFDLRPGAIIERLDLKRPIYAQTSSFGHFGNPSYTWEVIE